MPPRLHLGGTARIAEQQVVDVARRKSIDDTAQTGPYKEGWTDVYHIGSHIATHLFSLYVLDTCHFSSLSYRLDLCIFLHTSFSDKMGFKASQIFVVAYAAISLASLPLASAFYQRPTGPFATHYHDCCRPAFSYDHPKARTYAPVDTCEKDGLTLIAKEAQMSGKNGCDGGNQFACTCTMQQWQDSVDPELGYAFGAYINGHEPDGSVESACYLLNFKPQDPEGKAMKIKKLIVQNINTSGGPPVGSWDMSFAGGGVGDYNKGCTNQWGSQFGKTFGGVSKEEDCCLMPESLRSSCLFRFTLFGNNPELVGSAQRVRCPKGLIDRSGSQRADDAQTPVYSGKTDQTGQPAPDKYQRNRSVCQNMDPLGVVASVCGRLPKGSGMVRQDSPGGAVSGGPSGGQPEGYGSAADAGSTAGGGGTLAGGQPSPGSEGQTGSPSINPGGTNGGAVPPFGQTSPGSLGQAGSAFPGAGGQPSPGSESQTGSPSVGRGLINGGATPPFGQTSPGSLGQAGSAFPGTGGASGGANPLGSQAPTINPEGGAGGQISSAPIGIGAGLPFGQGGGSPGGAPKPPKGAKGAKGGPNGHGKPPKQAAAGVGGDSSSPVSPGSLAGHRRGVCHHKPSH